jgi:hypothetical protein
MRTIVLLLFSIALVCEAEDTNRPVTFRFISSTGYNDGGYLLSGTVFWATNHTTNTFDVWLSAIEVKTGSNWIVQARPMQSLVIQEPGKPVGSFYLNPHAAGYATPQLPTQPSGTKWRARARVRPLLSGTRQSMARVKGTPSRLLARFRTGETNIPMNPFSRFRTGETNIPMNPFSTNIHVFGKGTEVLSQEISDE